MWLGVDAMADRPIVIRAKHTKGYTKVRVLITHPMIGHNELDGSDDNRPHYIQDITCTMGEETILSALCGSYVGKDPFLAFEFEGGKKGEIIKVTWVDNWGERGSTESIIA
jgi:sulfur-oxidizing protein SoxZ